MLSSDKAKRAKADFDQRKVEAKSLLAKVGLGDHWKLVGWAAPWKRLGTAEYTDGEATLAVEPEFAKPMRTRTVDRRRA